MDLMEVASKIQRKLGTPRVEFSDLHNAEYHSTKLGYASVAAWIKDVPDPDERAAQVASMMAENAIELVMTHADKIPPNVRTSRDMDAFLKEFNADD